MMALLIVALVIIGLVVAVGLVVLVIMLRDAWRDRGVVDEDDWVADEEQTKDFFRDIGRWPL
jgi:hypothetical protein